MKQSKTKRRVGGRGNFFQNFANSDQLEKYSYTCRTKDLSCGCQPCTMSLLPLLNSASAQLCSPCRSKWGLSGDRIPCRLRFLFVIKKFLFLRCKAQNIFQPTLNCNSIHMVYILTLLVLLFHCIFLIADSLAPVSTLPLHRNDPQEASMSCSLRPRRRVRQPAGQSWVHPKSQLALIGQSWIWSFRV